MTVSKWKEIVAIYITLTMAIDVDIMTTVVKGSLGIKIGFIH